MHWVAASIVAGVLALVLIASVATDASVFCGTCHEMRPYVAAWYTGRHHGHAQCVDCHVNPGFLAHLVHKPMVLPEVWGHFFGAARFPLPQAAVVPDSRCVRCHPAVPDQLPSRFSHTYHVGKARCQECHPATGHDVSLAALGTEGVLSPPPPAPAVASGTHVTVSCSRCHDMRSRCEACHTAPHPTRGACAKCHRLGSRWVFAHPAGADCQRCHAAPAKHFGAPCTACHNTTVPFAQTTFQHPRIDAPHGIADFPCADCHPGGYASVSCTCHEGTGRGRGGFGD